MRLNIFAGAGVNNKVAIMSDWDEQQVAAWNLLYEQVTGLLARYGKENSGGHADYWVNEDNYGWRRISIGANNLKMLRPDIVNSLRKLLSELPEWEITLAVDILEKEKSWPLMGVTIRKHEVVDGLQRQYLPKEFLDVQYADSRPGTGYD
jgi:hypothetical protein